MQHLHFRRDQISTDECREAMVSRHAAGVPIRVQLSRCSCSYLFFLLLLFQFFARLSHFVLGFDDPEMITAGQAGYSQRACHRRYLNCKRLFTVCNEFTSSRSISWPLCERSRVHSTAPARACRRLTLIGLRSGPASRLSIHSRHSYTNRNQSRSLRTTIAAHTWFRGVHYFL